MVVKTPKRKRFKRRARFPLLPLLHVWTEQRIAVNRCMQKKTACGDELKGMSPFTSLKKSLWLKPIYRFSPLETINSFQVSYTVFQKPSYDFRGIYETLPGGSILVPGSGFWGSRHREFHFKVPLISKL